jgi:putative nucleotidyltransferase with HDIG domain
MAALVSLDRESVPSWWLIAALAAIAALAQRQAILLTARLETSVSFLPVLFAALAFGPMAGFLVAAGGAVLNLQRPYLRWFTYIPIGALAGCAAGWVASSISISALSFTTILLAAVGASAAYDVSHLGLSVTTGVIRRSGNAMSLIRAVAPLLGLTIPLYVPLVALFVYGYRSYSIWVVGGFLLPLLALQRVGLLYQEQRSAAIGLTEANERLERANLSFATALVATLDARDRYTAGHSAAVAIYARDIAARLGLSAAEQRLAHLCGLVHDIGKIGLPAGLLEKPGALTLEERRQMEEHSIIGERILANVEDYAEIAAIVRHHHERVDGNGYPDGLSLDQIPFVSRVIAVADAYNAMTSDRPYRDAMPSRVARMRLAQAVGSQFDTDIAAAFEAVLATSDEAYRMARSAEFVREGETLAEPRLSEVA